MERNLLSPLHASTIYEEETLCIPPNSLRKKEKKEKQTRNKNKQKIIYKKTKNTWL